MEEEPVPTNVDDAGDGTIAVDEKADDNAENGNDEGMEEKTQEGELVAEGEEVKGEEVAGEEVAGEGLEGEAVEGEAVEDEHKHLGEGEEVGEELLGEEAQGEETEEAKKEPEPEEVVEEEEAYVEEPPPDPAAPYDYTDSKEALKDPYQLRPDQLAEVEQLWDYYQNYCPAYSDIRDYITSKELVYMLKCLLLHPFTPEQLQELIEYCVRPPHPEDHITYEQFLRMVTLRQREFQPEDELRSALQVLDPEKTGSMDREYLKEVLSTLGHKMMPKPLDNLIKEVDIAGDGTIGIEDVVGTMCIDLNQEDIELLRNTLNPPEIAPLADDEF